MSRSASSTIVLRLNSQSVRFYSHFRRPAKLVTSFTARFMRSTWLLVQGWFMRIKRRLMPFSSQRMANGGWPVGVTTVEVVETGLGACP